MGSAWLGSLLSREPDAVPVALDVKGFTSTHLAIIASTGSGKSYLAGVLLEEMMMPHNRAAVLIVDPHGEYATLQEMQNKPEFREGNYAPTVRIFTPDMVKVSFDSLTLADLRYLLPNLSEKMHYQLGRAYSFAVRSAKARPLHPGSADVRRAPGGRRQEGRGGDQRGRPHHGRVDLAAQRACATAGFSTISRTWAWANSSGPANAPCSNSTRWTSGSSR